MAFAYSPKIVTDGLVFAVDAANTKSYPGSGTTWTDLTGGDSGTLTNTPTFSSNYGGIINFNGTDEYAAFGDNIIVTNKLSAFAWTRFYDTNQNPIAVKGIGYTGGREYGLYGFGSPFRIAAVVADESAGDVDVIYGNTTLSTNTWYYIGFVWDGSTTNMDVYLNGQDDGGGTTSVTEIENLSDSLNVGRNATNAGIPEYANADIAYIQIYNRVLSASEILQNYNALKSRFGL